MIKRRPVVAFAVLSSAAAFIAACASNTGKLDRDAQHALQNLYSDNPEARKLGARAVAVLVFPNIVKAGLLVGAQTGDGVLFVGGNPAGYYNISAASYGLQAGAQAFSYALFFMNNSALGYLRSSHGWSIGSGPSVVVVDRGAAASISSTTLTQDVYAFPFDQSGLMAGIGIEGSKITEITPG
jgi:lipid-binding SYLF domain-containing protein